MLTEKDYCDYEIVLELKELGYDYIRREGLIHLYDAQKFLRKERGMLLQPTYLELSDEWICVIRDKNKRIGYSAQKQKNYEEALLEGIKEAIKLLKEEK